jgi:hypothetical protein
VSYLILTQSNPAMGEGRHPHIPLGRRSGRAGFDISGDKSRDPVEAPVKYLILVCTNQVVHGPHLPDAATISAQVAALSAAAAPPVRCGQGAACWNNGRHG